MLPDYVFYSDTYHGNQIAESDFPRLIARASAYLESLNCDLTVVPDNTLNMALCAVSEAWQTNEQGGDLSSQSVGSWSKSFVQQKPKSNAQRLTEAAHLYLGKYCNLSVRWC